MNNAKRNRGLALLAAVLASGVASVAAGHVKVDEAWARATVPGAKVGAAYLTLTNSGADESKLLTIVSPVSDEVTLHRTSITNEGVARMWPLSGLELAGGETLRMHQGGVHVMFNKLKKPLVAGEKFPLTMKFEGGQPEFTVMVEVRPLVEAAEDHSHHHH